MKDKTDSDGKTAGRTFLVVDADGEGAEALRAELASRGFAVSVRRAETPDEAASGAALAEREVKSVLRNLTTPPPEVEAQVPSDGTVVAPGHGPECAVDGNPDTWFQTDGPARKWDMLFVRYGHAVRGTVSVQCGVPGSTNAPPAVGVGISFDDDPPGRRLGFIDPATGFFSGDIGEKPANKVVLVVTAGSDEPFAVQSVRVDP